MRARAKAIDRERDILIAADWFFAAVGYFLAYRLFRALMTSFM